MERLGIFGGTFNPIHYGHLRAAEETKEKLHLDRVLFIPAGRPSLKSEELLSAEYRLKMARMSIASNPAFQVLDIECRKPGISYSVDTVAELQGMYGGSELFFIIGVDAFSDIDKWKESARLMSLCDFALIERPGIGFAKLAGSPHIKSDYKCPMPSSCAIESGAKQIPMKSGRTAHIVPITAMDISSTCIRRMLRAGMSIKYMLPEDVESFIMSNGFYGN